jgi:hypothetical protein
MRIKPLCPLGRHVMEHGSSPMYDARLTAIWTCQPFASGI